MKARKWPTILLVGWAGMCAFGGPSHCSAPIVYCGAPIRGKVVDAETGKPLAGAVVSSKHMPFHAGLHGSHRGAIHETAVETAADGTFEVPWWGPRIRWPWLVLIDDPIVIVYKHGYESWKHLDQFPSNSVVRFSLINEWEIELRRFTGTTEELRRQISHGSNYGARHPRFLKELGKDQEAIWQLDR